jgi:very-short-patch-repair endonuclease
MREKEDSKTKKERIDRIYGGATPEKFRFAQEQRRNPTVTENLLWTQLRAKRLNGHKFRRQHPYNHFVLDFFCIRLNLCVEIDGEVHNETQNAEYDKVRTQVLKDNGISEIRFTNHQVLYEMEAVLRKISEKCRELEGEL